MTSSPKLVTARCTTDRITAFRPGQSPPAVRTPIRIVLCLLLAAGTCEPVRLFHEPKATDDSLLPTRTFVLAGALATLRGIVKRVPLTPVGHFSEPRNHPAPQRMESTRDPQRLRHRDRPRRRPPGRRAG